MSVFGQETFWPGPGGTRRISAAGAATQQFAETTFQPTPRDGHFAQYVANLDGIGGVTANEKPLHGQGLDHRLPVYRSTGA